jgi:hypothetical protein
LQLVFISKFAFEAQNILIYTLTKKLYYNNLYNVANENKTFDFSRMLRVRKICSNISFEQKISS